MIVLHGFDCPANIVRGRLSHSWLANRILTKSEGDVLLLWREFAEWEELGAQFLEEADAAIELADTLEQGFSPARLIDMLSPFTGLAEDTRQELKQVLHALYLKETQIDQLKEPLQEAGEAIKLALEELKESWLLPRTDGNAAQVAAKWNAVLSSARKLQTILEKLPKGIVLP